MSQRKHCFYKGCASKQIPGVQSDLTFFQFPRDEVRYNLWMKLSKCENKDSPVKYLCSKHFDERKYISRNPRRLLLLASALPYEYVSGDEDVDNEVENEEEQIHVVTSKLDDEDFLIQSMDVSEFTAEAECGYAESTINEVEYVHEDMPSKSYEFINKKRKWQSEAENGNAVSTAKSSELSVYQSDKNQISTSKCDDHIPRIVQEDIGVKKLQQSDKEELVDNPNITTFIFKGEEYIQMPKRIYIQEKNELMASLHYYKDIVMNIKSQIDDAKL